MKIMFWLFPLIILFTNCSEFTNFPTRLVKRFPAAIEGVDDSKTIDGPVGIYSGSFDPPTNAHKKIMGMALEKYKLEKFYILVNASGRKDFKASFYERQNMILAMLKGLDQSKIKVIPVLNENREIVNQKLINSTQGKVVQFVGQDSFELAPEVALYDQNKQWVVFPRGDHPVKIPDGVNAETVDIDIGETSSSEIRKLINNNQITKANLDPEVAKYIESHNLYRALPNNFIELQNKLYQESFQDFIDDLRKVRPNYKLDNLEVPPFVPEQSPLAWADKFSNYIIKNNNLKDEDAEAFRILSRDLLCGLFNGVQYPKMASISAIRLTELDEKKPVILKVIKEKLSNKIQDKDKNKKYNIDINKYQRDRFPFQLQNYANIEKSDIFIHDGSLKESIQYHRAEGFNEIYLVNSRKGHGHRKMLLVSNSQTGDSRIVLAEVTGKDRTYHTKNFMTTKFTSTATIVSHRNKLPSLNLNSLGETIKFGAMDRVIIGYKGDIGRKLSGTGKYQKITITNPGGIDVDVYENIQTKQKISVVRNSYGDEIKAILDLFYQKNVRDFVYMGNAGILDPTMKIGDILLPNAVIDEKGHTVKFNNAGIDLIPDDVNPSDVKVNTTHGWVSSIMDESNEFLEGVKKSGAASLDVEAKYIADFFSKKTDAKVAMFIFASDEPLGEVTFDSYNTVEVKIDKSISKIVPVVTAENYPVNNRMPNIKSSSDSASCMSIMSQIISAH